MTLILAASGTDPWKHYSFIATVFAAIFAAVWALKQWRDETAQRREDQKAELETRRAELKQRDKDLRWKQARLAREMMDAIFDYKPSNDAWRMVDSEQAYKYKGNSYTINMNDVRRALPEPWSDDCSGSPVYIRWCFDALFYYIEQIEHALKLDILRFEDLEASASYYIALMAKDKKLFHEYVKLIRLNRALAFMDRFPEWKDAQG